MARGGLKKTTFWKEIKREKWSYIMLTGPISIIFFFRILPFLWALVISFFTYTPAMSTQWTGIRNYLTIFQDEIFLKSMQNTAIFTLGVVPGGLFIALLLATLIYHLPKATRTLFKGAFYLPVVTSGAILSLIWLYLFNPTYGFLNYLLDLLHLPELLWLASPKTALPSLIVMTLATAHGASIILLTATMGSIPTSFYEAARLDGSNRWQEFWYITLPLLRPIILFLLITSTISSFQVFTQIYMMTEGGPNYATITVVFRIYQVAFDLFQLGPAFAGVIIIASILLIIAFLQYKYLSTEIEY